MDSNSPGKVTMTSSDSSGDLQAKTMERVTVRERQRCFVMRIVVLGSKTNRRDKKEEYW